MKIKKIELKNFKRFNDLTIEKLPKTTKLVVLVGPNGSGKTSLLESMNHYYKYVGYCNIGNHNYLYKNIDNDELDHDKWFKKSSELVDISFYDADFTNAVGQNNDIKGHFYFRSAYRNEPEFKIDIMQKQKTPTEYIRLESLNLNDQTVSANYQRIVDDSISALYDEKNNNETALALRKKLIGSINSAMERIFGDLTISSIGMPLVNGNFYFKKGITNSFSYCNLSAGEKSVFDLILDITIQSKYYSNAIYCIDEPEAHMHTQLQGKVLRELYQLIPDKSQLWISTHSIGMIKEAEEIEIKNPNTVVFLDFSGKDFDMPQIICPEMMNKAIRDKFYELAFDDFANLMLPKTIIFCEGDSNGNNRKDFDKNIYTNIFANNHPDAVFISNGSCNDIERIESTHGNIINALLEKSKIIKIVDLDNRSPQEVESLNAQGINVLTRRNLESYLFDDEVIKKLCELHKKPEKYDACIKAKQDALNESIKRDNPKDDYKSAKGDIYNAIRKQLGLTQCGNNADTFMRDTLSTIISPDMNVYKELEKDIFYER